MFVNVRSTVKFLLWLLATIIDIVGVSMPHFARSCMHIVVDNIQWQDVPCIRPGAMEYTR